MEQIKIYLERLISLTGLTGDYVPVVRYVILVIASFLLAWLAGWVCRRFFVPLVQKVTRRTEVKWDDVIFSERVLLSASRIVPAIVIWALLPLVFFEYPKVAEIVGRLTAIYFTVMATRTVIVGIDSLKNLEGERRTAKLQYLYTITSVLKILMIFIAVIVVVAIVINKNPSTLFAGLGAASAILMLAFQDTIKGLVAGVRLTSNDMLHIGDWITLPSAGANGKVEEISLTMVKVRNFDNTVVTVTPQMLVDGSFQNWQGMLENEGRKQVRKVYFDFRSLQVDDDGVANITKYRRHIEQWLKDNPKVVGEKNPLVRQAEAAQAGCCLEFVFWLKAQNAIDYEHDTSDIMEYIFAACADYGLRIYQQFPEQ
ncbi:MAG: mechanosensitive ion channel family protein [Prevotella sp.]|nr:mechanosensitive ion channel family protein [Prevotella sp.]